MLPLLILSFASHISLPGIVGETTCSVMNSLWICRAIKIVLGGSMVTVVIFNAESGGNLINFLPQLFPSRIGAKKGFFKVIVLSDFDFGQF